jgi:hypothetical protein
MLHQLPKELLLEQVANGLILLLLGMGVVFLALRCFYPRQVLSLLVKNTS